MPLSVYLFIRVSINHRVCSTEVSNVEYHYFCVCPLQVRPKIPSSFCPAPMCGLISQGQSLPRASDARTLPTYVLFSWLRRPLLPGEVDLHSCSKYMVFLLDWGPFLCGWREIYFVLKNEVLVFPLSQRPVPIRNPSD